MLGRFTLLLRAADGVKAHKRRRTNLIQQLLVILLRYIQLFRHLGIGRHPSLCLLKSAYDLLNFSCLVMNRTRHPVELSQLIKNRAANADPGIRFEENAGLMIVSTHGVQKSDQPRAVKIFRGDVRRKSHGETAHDRANER